MLESVTYLTSRDTFDQGNVARHLMVRVLACPDLGDTLPPESDLAAVLLSDILGDGTLRDWALPHAVFACARCNCLGNPDLVASYLLRIAAIRLHLKNLWRLSNPAQADWEESMAKATAKLAESVTV